MWGQLVSDSCGEENGAAWVMLLGLPGAEEMGRSRDLGCSGEVGGNWAARATGPFREDQAELGQIQEREKRENKIPFLIFSTQFQIQFKSKFKSFCKF